MRFFLHKSAVQDFWLCLNAQANNSEWDCDFFCLSWIAYLPLQTTTNGPKTKNPIKKNP